MKKNEVQKNFSLKKWKEGKGITLIALVVTIVVLLILAGVTISTLMGDNGIITRANKAKEAAEQAERDELARLQSIEDEINNRVASTQGFNEKKEVNSPKLAKGMIPIKHNGTNWVVCSETDDEWYNYDDKKEWANVMLSDGTYKQTQVEEGQVIQEDELGSMFVWIPRYAYKINGEKDIDVTFLTGNTNKDKDGVTYIKPEAETDTKITKVVHPGFTLGTKELTGIWVAKFEASGTDKNGNAVGNANSTTNAEEYEPDETTTVKILPNVISWRHITVGESEKRSMDITTINKEVYGIDYASSHLMKNSEWGAVAYLSYSQYGSVPQINAAGSYLSSGGHFYNIYTGQGPKANGNTSRYDYTDGANNYNTTNGKLASTTGNVTGIYDMSGGAWERVAGYLDNGNGNLNTYGKSADGSIKYFENGELKSEYADLWDAYEVSEEEKNNEIEVAEGETLTQNQLWNDTKQEEKYQIARQRLTQATFEKMAKHKGIGVNEVATECSFYAPFTNESGTRAWGWFKTAAQAVAGTQSHATSWDGDLTLIGHAALPFVARGGGCDNGSSAGVLYTSITDGHAGSSSGFRPVVVL